MPARELLFRLGKPHLQVERGHAAQRRQRQEAVVDERHVAPAVQRQRPARCV